MRLIYSEKKKLLERINKVELTILNDEPCRDDYETFEEYCNATNRTENRNHKVSEILGNLRRQVLDNKAYVSRLTSNADKILDKIIYEYWGEY